ncbi:MAG: IS66 family transposase [Planctomycetota bacterium]
MGNLRRIRKQMGAISHRAKPSQSKPGDPECVELEMSELEAIIERSKAGPLHEQDCEQLRSVLRILYFLTQELEKKHVSVKRLKQMLFGATTETTRKVIEQILDEAGQEKKSGDEAEADSETEARQKAKGHGRNGADAYTGAEKVHVPHNSLKAGDACPDCKKGTVYEMAEPGRLVRVRGQAPLGATVYELQKLRCSLCGAIFTAATPQGVGTDKYDAESASMIALLKYGSGLPFNRLERLQGSLGIPLPAATQWEIVEHSADRIEPVFEEMIYHAAQGRVLHNDDTTMKVLALCNRHEKSVDGALSPASERTGVFTSGIVSVLEGHQIALFFTGHRHAGENLTDLLKQRAPELDKPIQMCDALSRNMPEELETLIANCLTHGRRRFVEVAVNFPEECLYVLEVLKEVYKNDAEAKRRGFSDPQRLQWHQVQSGPKMADLKNWLDEQIEQHKVEPNSSLGEAIGYMLRHWNELTLFLRQPGAPLDNNVCERALKKAILHRKNSYFYKTQNGARVGDLFMSIIHTCELNTVNPFDYLTRLQKNAEAAASDPADWMP